MDTPDATGFLGYIKYDGRLVEDGIIDARAAATALNGLDAALRYFVAQQEPELAAVEFAIPVRIQNGSWAALIPKTIGEWIVAGGGLALTAYLTTAAKKLAEHDFKDVGIADVFRKALSGLQWFVKIGKHLGTLAEKRISDLRWRDNNAEVGIPDEHGHFLVVPRNYFELFMEAPSGLLSRLAEIIEVERNLTIGRIVEGVVEEVSVTHREKHIFYIAEDVEGEILFPELVHGQAINPRWSCYTWK
jgi:hypothetical protein